MASSTTWRVVATLAVSSVVSSASTIVAGGSLALFAGAFIRFAAGERLLSDDLGRFFGWP